MSKLIDKLRKISQATPQPMGFHTSKPVEVSGKLLIIGRFKTTNSVTTTKKNTGADAILFYSNKSEILLIDIQKMAKLLGDIPWGIYLQEGEYDTAGLIKAGGDFVVFSPTSQIADLPQDEKIGKILQVESSMDDGLLRAINDLPADAVMITDTLDNDETLTMHRLMIYRHLANSITKPLIVPVTVKITEAELKALHEAEIDGVTVEMDGEDLKELRKTISKLPARSAKKRERGGVTLPRIGGETTTPSPPDEEEEEDE
jgi:hypothetical protein